jgi:hypothetical protein
MVKEEEEGTPLYFKKKVNSLEYMIDDFHDKITKCNTKHLIDDAIEMEDKIISMRIDFRQKNASPIFVDDINGLQARFNDLKSSFEKDCKCK